MLRSELCSRLEARTPRQPEPSDVRYTIIIVKRGGERPARSRITAVLAPASGFGSAA
jgi:hypothetical protein